MSVIVVAPGVNTFGPIGGTGTGNGYYDGATNDTASSCGAVVPVSPLPALNGRTVNALSDSLGGTDSGFVLAVQGTVPQSFFDSVGYVNSARSGTLTSAAAIYSQRTEGLYAYTLWRWASSIITGSSGNSTFTFMSSIPPSITLAVPTVIDSTAIDLAWTPVVGTATDAGTFTDMEVWRNGVRLVTLAASAVTYLDLACQPGTAYTYEIRALYSLGGFSPVISNDQTLTTPDLNAEFNCECEATSSFATLAALRTRMMIRLGYANQASNPPPGMVALLNEFLQDAQRTLYKAPTGALRTERFFKWTMTPGLRYYGIGNAEGACTKQLDEHKITWVGFQDLNLAWYPLAQGIPPELYTRVGLTVGYPSRYEIRSCIEIFPAPRAAYTLWIKGHFGLDPFAADGDQTTIDDELVFLVALGNAKAHYGQKDTNTVLTQAADYRRRLVAGSHATARYVPKGWSPAPMTPPHFLPLDSP